MKKNFFVKIKINFNVDFTHKRSEECFNNLVHKKFVIETR